MAALQRTLGIIFCRIVIAAICLVGGALLRADDKAPVPSSAAGKILDGSVLLMTFEPDTFVSNDDEVYVVDMSGLGNHGIVAGATQTPAGRAGGALKFGGQDSVLLPALWTHLTGKLKQLSLSFWVSPAGLKGSQFVFDVGYYASRSISLNLRNAEFAFLLPNHRGGKTCRSDKVEAGQWYHVVGVWNGVEQKIYVNGQPKRATPTDGLTLDVKSVARGPARIGTQAKSGYREKRYFRGAIDEVAIFSRALSEEEIQTLHQMGLQGKKLVESPQREERRTDERTVAVLGFADKGPSVELAPLRIALAEMLTGDLSQFEGVQTVEGVTRDSRGASFERHGLNGC